MEFGFCDLCINGSDLEQIKIILNRLYQFGYTTVALNENVDESIFDNQKKKKKQSRNNENILPETFSHTVIDNLKDEFKGKLKILRRFTFAYSEPSKIHFLNQLSILKKYELFAIIPKTQNALQHACANLSVDIITIQPENFGLKFNRKLYYQAIEKDIHIEIQYAHVINHSTRKFAIYHSHLFYTFGKSKNVIISSGASTSSFIRSPYDIINLARILGLNEEKAKSSILQKCHDTILKGEGRQRGKAIFIIRHQQRNSKEEDEGSALKVYE